MTSHLIFVLLAITSVALGTLLYPEEKHLANVRQLTFGGQNAEAYWRYDDFCSKIKRLQNTEKFSFRFTETKVTAFILKFFPQNTSTYTSLKNELPRSAIVLLIFSTVFREAIVPISTLNFNNYTDSLLHDGKRCVSVLIRAVLTITAVEVEILKKRKTLR